MLRAVLGTRVRSLIERNAQDVALFIPSYCVAEVHECLPSLCAKRNWEPAPTFNLLDALLTFAKVVESAVHDRVRGHGRSCDRALKLVWE